MYSLSASDVVPPLLSLAPQTVVRCLFVALVLGPVASTPLRLLGVCASCVLAYAPYIAVLAVSNCLVCSHLPVALHNSVGPPLSSALIGVPAPKVRIVGVLSCIECAICPCTLRSFIVGGGLSCPRHIIVVSPKFVTRVVFIMWGARCTINAPVSDCCRPKRPSVKLKSSDFLCVLNSVGWEPLWCSCCTVGQKTLWEKAAL